MGCNNQSIFEGAISRKCIVNFVQYYLGKIPLKKTQWFCLWVSGKIMDSFSSSWRKHRHIWDLLIHLFMAEEKTAWSREYWMIYTRPGFLAVVWFVSSPTSSSLSFQQGVPLPQSPQSSSILTGGEAKSYDVEKFWSSIKRSIVTGLKCLWRKFSERVLLSWNSEQKESIIVFVL